MKQFAVILIICLTCNLITKAQGGTIITVVGNGVPGYSGDGGPASSAELKWPVNVSFDKSNNIYIADQANNRIRKVDISTGTITTVAGNGIAGYYGDGGSAISAEINFPSSVIVDDSGNIYLTDFYNNCVREVMVTTGNIYTIAGTSVGGFSGDGGPASAAELNRPHQTALDAHGNLLIADENNNRIRKVNLSTGIISEVAGNRFGSFSGDGGPATAAELWSPKCVALDDSGNIFIADWLNHRIRKIRAKDSIITTVAGDGISGYCCDNGPATAAELTAPYRVAIDSSGNFFTADGSDNCVRWVNVSTGIIKTLAGNGKNGFTGDGGPAKAAELNDPVGLCFDHNGNLFIADQNNCRIREIINTTGYDSFENVQPEVAIYPNPAGVSTWVHFNVANSGATLSLFSITGQLVWKSNTLSTVIDEEIPLNNLYSGIYFLEVQVQTNNQIQASSVIWNRIEVIR